MVVHQVGRPCLHNLGVPCAGRQRAGPPDRSVRVVCTGPNPGAVKGGERQWVRPDRLWDALAATGGTGVEELPHVPGVLIRARRARCRPPVAAPDQQHPIRLGLGRVGNPPAGLVTVLDTAAKPNRAGAVPAPGDLLSPPIEVRPPSPTDDLLHRLRGKNGPRVPRFGRSARDRTKSTALVLVSHWLVVFPRIGDRGPVDPHTNQTMKRCR
jgi:hypothetical protein